MGMGVPLLRVAVKVTDWLTAGVVFDAVRVSAVDALVMLTLTVLLVTLP